MNQMIQQPVTNSNRAPKHEHVVVERCPGVENRKGKCTSPRHPGNLGGVCDLCFDMLEAGFEGVARVRNDKAAAYIREHVLGMKPRTVAPRVMTTSAPLTHAMPIPVPAPVRTLRLRDYQYGVIRAVLDAFRTDRKMVSTGTIVIDVKGVPVTCVGTRRNGSSMDATIRVLVDGVEQEGIPLRLSEASFSPPAPIRSASAMEEAPAATSAETVAGTVTEPKKARKRTPKPLPPEELARIEAKKARKASLLASRLARRATATAPAPKKEKKGGDKKGGKNKK